MAVATTDSTILYYSHPDCFTLSLYTIFLIDIYDLFIGLLSTIYCTVNKFIVRDFRITVLGNVVVHV